MELNHDQLAKLIAKIEEYRNLDEECCEECEASEQYDELYEYQGRVEAFDAVLNMIIRIIEGYEL